MRIVIYNIIQHFIPFFYKSLIFFIFFEITAKIGCFLTFFCSKNK